jgi:phospholipid/cholesterol/gamma-HCH transport system substrate-binding protein
MNRTRSNYLKVGITVFLSVIILLYGIAFLKDFKIDLQTNDLVVYFTDVNGLKEGDPVSVNGVPKGKVSTIELAGDSVKVSFNLSKDVVIKKDYNITVAMIELMSGKQVSVKPGKSKELADITRPLSGAKANDVVTLIETMNNVGDKVQNIVGKMDTAIDNVSKAVNSINDIVGDPVLRSDIRTTTGNFSSASQNLNLLVLENRENLRSLTSRLNDIANSVDNTVTETRPELKETIGDIRQLTSRLDSVAFNLNQFVIDTRDTNSTVGKLVSDDKLYENLNKTVLSMNKLINEIKKKGIRLRLF